MGNCIYCGQPAGFFRSKHKACAQEQSRLEKAQAERESLGRKDLESRLLSFIHSEEPLAGAPALVDEVAATHDLTAEQLRPAAIAACEAAIAAAMEDSLLTREEEHRIVACMEKLGLSRNDLGDRDAWGKLVKLATLRDIMSGLNPSRLSIDEHLSINFRKGETIIWAFPNCDYLEDRSRISYVGGSQGISVRVMQGVYYRVGAFKGERVSRTERVHVDTGWVVITQKNIYFAGPKKSLRIPYEKIVSFLPFKDGIGVMKDTATAKPQIFVTGDGWFTYNAVTNLASR